MPDVITLLPDSVANQIAAGEVIQRPASVVKELVENAVDAGSGQIKVLIKDAGKTLIQVIDNGSGMSETDARLSFERHATSKIKSADDLFTITTKGFRGEALASIAAVSQTELKSRRPEDELGSLLEISGSKVLKQEPVSTPAGSNFAVKNLFFNIPARRKFLKSDQTELKHIITEFQRIVLAHPDVQFSLYHNDQEMFKLTASPLKQRIIQLFGKNYNQHLVNLSAETSIVQVRGFIGKPAIAKKNYGEQFFFINNRFMKHPYLHRAVLNAYENLLPKDTLPSYFIYLEAEPASVDVNIHPTKTEIKFEDERSIWQILHATIREALGKFNIGPSLDFDNEGMIDIPVKNERTDFIHPEPRVDRSFNPFDFDKAPAGSSRFGKLPDPVSSDWEKLYEGIRREEPALIPEEQTSPTAEHSGLMQIKNRYIVSAVKSGIMLIDQHRAHERILFERFIRELSRQQPVSQKCLYPDRLVFEPAMMSLLEELSPDLKILGYELEKENEETLLMKAYPALLPGEQAARILRNMLEEYEQSAKDPGLSDLEKMAWNMAKAAAIPYGRKLQPDEIRELFDSLFACQLPNYTVTGKPVISILSTEELDQRFGG